MRRCQHLHVSMVLCRPELIPVVVYQCDMCGALLRPDDDAMFMADDEREVLPSVDKAAALAYARRLDDEAARLEAILKTL